jgi:hypothetical protein
MTNGRCRVSGIVSEEYADKDTISFEEVNRDFAKNLNMDVTLSDPEWISVLIELENLGITATLP